MHPADSYCLSYSRRYCWSGMQGDQRSKMARRPESGTDSGGLTETQERGDFEVEQEGQIKAE